MIDNYPGPPRRSRYRDSWFRAAATLCAERLAWLEDVLTSGRERPTVVFMHHPPFRTGIDHMDVIGLAAGDAFGAIIERHPQVERVLCGHLHRAIQVRWRGTLAATAPSTAHQVALDLRPGADGVFALEPPGSRSMSGPRRRDHLPTVARRPLRRPASLHRGRRTGGWVRELPAPTSRRAPAWCRRHISRCCSQMPREALASNSGEVERFNRSRARIFASSSGQRASRAPSPHTLRGWKTTSSGRPARAGGRRTACGESRPGRSAPGKPVHSASLAVACALQGSVSRKRSASHAGQGAPRATRSANTRRDRDRCPSPAPHAKPSLGRSHRRRAATAPSPTARSSRIQTLKTSGGS